MVCDGHGGTDEVAELVRSNLPGHIVSKIASLDTLDALPDILRSSFAAMNGFLEQVAGTRGGTTCTVAIVTPTHIVFAWIGDSPGILVDQSGSLLFATRDHDCSHEGEVARVTAAGGRCVTDDKGITRLQGDTMNTRSFGDFHLSPYLIATPDIAIIPRTGTGKLILGSDYLTESFTRLPDGRSYIANLLHPADVAAELQPFLSSGSLHESVSRAVETHVNSFYYPQPTEESGRYLGDNATLVVVDLQEPGIVSLGGRRARKPYTKKLKRTR